MADRTRLTEIVLNLLSNAIKFTELGGSITIAMHRTRDGGARLLVKDTGAGMTAAEIEIALELFGQVDAGLARRHEGSGLGLPLARKLAELHGGSLIVESEEGRGTTITVTLPPARVVPADTPTPAGATAGSARSIETAVDPQPILA
jgi:signal transduction histidine kinase